MQNSYSHFWRTRDNNICLSPVNRHFKLNQPFVMSQRACWVWSKARLLCGILELQRHWKDNSDWNLATKYLSWWTKPNIYTNWLNKNSHKCAFFLLYFWKFNKYVHQMLIIRQYFLLSHFWCVALDWCCCDMEFSLQFNERSAVVTWYWCLFLDNQSRHLQSQAAHKATGFIFLTLCLCIRSTSGWLWARRAHTSVVLFYDVWLFNDTVSKQHKSRNSKLFQTFG